MDPIKEAFQKVKDDIDFLKFELQVLKMEIESIKDVNINRTQQIIPTDQEENPTIQQINPTETQTPTDNLPYQALITSNSISSTGNGGVPTDRQTDKQTDTPTHQEFALSEEIQSQELQKSPEYNEKFAQSLTLPPTPEVNSPIQKESLPEPISESKESKIDHLERISEILNSLDEIKKDLRHKFKRLTHQEMLVFSAIYQLEEQQIVVDYPTLASKLSLSESSIRDYVLKIIKKGVPINKVKENNKKIILQISPDLKKIASLQTILALREI